MTNESSFMTMKSDNESKLVNTSNNNNIVNNNNNIYYTCNTSSSNKSTTTTTNTPTTATSSTTTASVSDLPSITLAPFAKIKRETDCISNRSSSSTSMVMKSINISNNNSQVPTSVSNSNNNNNNTVSAKMGSRRIFTPQFKLQVLESYRNDADCKGNQRATARKYNIHRRQIQKWLQCESNLRSSVANICANNVKHQFHNITHHQMPIVTNSTMPLQPSTAAVAAAAAAAASVASSSIHSNNNQLQHHHHQHHHHHHQQHAHHNQQQYKAINNRLSLDTTRHSVALTSIQIPTNKGVLAAAAAASASSSTSTSAAAANNVGDVVGAVAPLSSSSSSSSSPSSTAFMSTSTVKSLRAPTSPVLHSQILTKSSTAVAAAAAAVSPTKGGLSAAGAPLHAYHHHDGMSIHTPPASLSSVPVSVPIITPHPHTHLHVTNLKIHHYQHLHMEQHHHHHHQQQHHHHNLHHPYNQVQLPPPPPQHQHQHQHQHQQQQQQSSERRSFMPSASLPVLPTSLSSSSSSPSASSSSFSTTTTSPSSPPASTPLTAVALSCTDTLATNSRLASAACAGRVAVPLPLPLPLSLAAHVEENRIDELRDYRSTSTENRYMNENEYAAAVQSRTLMHRAYEGFHYLPMPMHMYPAAALSSSSSSSMIAPIDLSLGPKRLAYGPEYTATLIKDEDQQQPSSPKSEIEDDDDSQLNVVDSDISESSSSVVDLTLRKRKVLMPVAGDSDDVTAEKHTKTEQPSAEPPKTFKLFKPYLLDDDNDGNATTTSDANDKSNDDASSNKICKQKDPIIWSHHAACLSPPISIDSLQSSSRGSNFQSPPVDASYPFPAGSPTFQSTTNASINASAAGFRCPKGSPVSGYESSSSIYSDSASSNGGDNNTTSPNPNSITISYHFDLKMQNINGDNSKSHVISPTPIKQRPFIADVEPLLPPTNHINHVQRWLDQESGIRQGIAVYV